MKTGSSCISVGKSQNQFIHVLPCLCRIVFILAALTRPGDRHVIHAEDDADGPIKADIVVVLVVSLLPVTLGLVKAAGLRSYGRLCLGLNL